MRSHPGSTPNDGTPQIWDDEATILFAKKFVKIHVALADYKMQLMQEHYTLGRPFTRAMMLQFPDVQEVRHVID